MFTLKHIALEVSGMVVGDDSIIISAVDDIEEASSGAITFAFLPKYKKVLTSSDASAFVVTNKEDLQGSPGIVVENPYLAMIKILELFSKKKIIEHKISANAEISKSAKIGKNVSISSFSVIKNNVVIEDDVTIGSGVKINEGAIIGKNSCIKDNVIIYEDVHIGKHALIHSGTIIGSDGFGFTTIGNEHHKIPHIKAVIIGDFVEMGASCTIDRGSVKNTVIGDNCKLDNQVHIAHNVQIAQGCLLAAGVFIGGSSTVEEYCMVAGKTDIGPHITIGKGSMFAARSCVLKSLSGGEMYAGNPARPIKEKQERDAVYTKLKIIEKKLKQADAKKTKNN